MYFTAYSLRCRLLGLLLLEVAVASTFFAGEIMAIDSNYSSQLLQGPVVPFSAPADVSPDEFTMLSPELCQQIAAYVPDPGIETGRSIENYSTNQLLEGVDVRSTRGLPSASSEKNGSTYFDEIGVIKVAPDGRVLRNGHLLGKTDTMLAAERCRRMGLLP